MADIFLSYKRTDRDRVAPIVALLEARGWSVWWDTRIDAGEQWDEVIEREVSAASCVVAIWSSQSVNSRWVRTEASEGLERGILVPVLIDPTRPPLEFKRVHAIDLTGWKGDAEEPSARKLAGAVARFLGQCPVDTADSCAELQNDNRAGSTPGQTQWGIIERCRHWTRLAKSLAGRFAVVAKARVGGLAVRAGNARVALREKLARGIAVAILPALAVALIAAAGLALWLIDRPEPRQEPPEADIVLKLAKRHIADRDILRARRVLTAYEDFAPGRITLALGETYDPNMLAAWGSVDVPADPKEAKRLYDKALKLGVPGAKTRLENLAPPEPPAVKARPRIAVAPTIVARSPSKTEMPIQVSPREALPKNAFVRLRGLPARVSLSEGHTEGAGSWVVPMFALAALKAVVPAGLADRRTIVILLVGADGTTLAEAMTDLVIVEPPAPGEPPAGTQAEETVERTSPAPVSEEERVRSAKRQLMLGWRNWESGSILSARGNFRHAFELGLADGAIGMGKTYDPHELNHPTFVAVVSDRKEARKWYERARKLGAPDAQWRLERLERAGQPVPR